MQADEEWKLIRPGRQSPAAWASAGILRVTLLFGLGAVALTLVATSFLGQESRLQLGQMKFNGLDFTATGSISRNGTYTLRRSVLQETPQSVCVIHANGSRSGQC